MRILHIFDHSLPLQSGYVSRSLSIIRSQRARGWETLHATTPRYLPSLEKHETVDGLTFYRSPKVNVSLPVARELVEMRTTKRMLAEIIRAERPDVLHAHSPVLTALPTIAVGRKFNVPVVYEVRALWEDAAVDLGTTREGDLRYNISRWLETFAMRRVDQLIVLCNPLRQEIVARGIPAERVTVVPNAVDSKSLTATGPVDVSLREQLGLKDRTVLGFIGSFYAYEGLDLLLEVAPILRQRHPRLAILLVGGGPDEDRLRRIVQQSGIEDIVRFTGRVHHGDVERYYGLIDIMVFPRRRRRLTDLVTPLKPLEAMAYSKPVVASDVGGHRELISDSQTGYLFPSDDAIALVAKLEQVLANDEDRARVIANGRNFVTRERNWDVVVERYAAVYAEAIANRKAER